MLLAKANGTKDDRAEKRAVGERSRAGKDGEATRKEARSPELVKRPRRRTFSAKYKLGIVQEADGCTESGEIGALLRREGLYSSHLSTWRRQRDEGALTAFSKRRGQRKTHPLKRENAELRRRAERAELELEKARKVIEVQGNVSTLLGELLGPEGENPDESSDE